MFFLKIFSNVRTYVTVRIDEDKITSERVNRKKYGAIGTWIDDNLYSFCFKIWSNLIKCQATPQ